MRLDRAAYVFAAELVLDVVIPGLVINYQFSSKDIRGPIKAHHVDLGSIVPPSHFDHGG